MTLIQAQVPLQPGLQKVGDVLLHGVPVGPLDVLSFLHGVVQPLWDVARTYGPHLIIEGEGGGYTKIMSNQ